MVKWMPPSETTLCQCLAVTMCASAYGPLWSTIFGLPDVPDEKYMSSGSDASVSPRSNSAGVARTAALKSTHPSRSAVSSQTWSGPLSTAPRVGSSGSPVPPPPPLTRKSSLTDGQRDTVASTTSGMNPCDVQITYLTSAEFRRYSRSCSLSMKVAGTMTAPILCSATAVNQNW